MKLKIFLLNGILNIIFFFNRNGLHYAFMSPRSFSDDSIIRYLMYPLYSFRESDENIADIFYYLYFYIISKLIFF